MHQQRERMKGPRSFVQKTVPLPLSQRRAQAASSWSALIRCPGARAGLRS